MNYRRIRLETPDKDFLDIDMLQNGHRRLAILCHGLEGSSDSLYIQGTASLLNKGKWDVAAMNYRSCSGVINKQARMYHSGATEDLDLVFQEFHQKYDEIAMVGFSLGGNLVLKFCGERSNKISDSIISVVAISVPTNLSSGSKHLMKASNYFYTSKFLKSLKDKVKTKHEQFPEVFDISGIEDIKSVYDFDDNFTAPVHGFNDAEDYYTQSSSAQFIGDITISGLIINALDDPFLSDECYPFEECSKNGMIELVTPKYGGHVGFTCIGKDHYWEEIQILEYLNKCSRIS